MPNGSTKTTYTYDNYFQSEDGTFQAIDTGTNTTISNPIHTTIKIENSSASTFNDGTLIVESTSDNAGGLQYGVNPNGDFHLSGHGTTEYTFSESIDGTMTIDNTYSTTNHFTQSENHWGIGGVSTLTDNLSGSETRTNYSSNTTDQGTNIVEHIQVDGENTINHYNTYSDDLLI